MEHSTAFATSAPHVISGSVSTPVPTGVVVGVSRCLVAFCDWSACNISDSASQATRLGNAARACWICLRSNGRRLTILRRVEGARQLPRARAAGVRFWVGPVKRFSRVEQLAHTMGTGVSVLGSGDATSK